MKPLLPMLETPWTGREERRPCPVCGKSWAPYAGSRLPCHSGCLLSEGAQDELLHRLEAEAGLTAPLLARQIGLPMAVARVSVQAALKRRLRANTVAKRAADRVVVVKRVADRVVLPDYRRIADVARLLGVPLQVVKGWVASGRLQERAGTVSVTEATALRRAA